MSDPTLCAEFIETGSCGHTDVEHDALNDAHPTPAEAMETYAEEMRDQIAHARQNAAVICVIDGDGQLAVTSPMGYGRRQVAAMLSMIGAKIDRACDDDGIPALEDDEKPTDIPDDAVHEA